MMKLRILVAAIALGVTAPAFAADAELDGSWDTKYGMVFEACNIFQNTPFLIGYQGGIGVQYNLAPTRALRGVVDLARSSDPSYTIKVKNLVTNTTTEPFDQPGDSVIGVSVGAAYLMRLGTAALSPYVGAGGRIALTHTSQNWEDKTTSATETEKYDLSRNVFAIGASGLVGLEWRVHKMISIFAEYGVVIDLMQYYSETEEDKITNKTTGAVVAGSFSTETSRTRFFQLDTGMTQGATLGLVAHF